LISPRKSVTFQLLPSGKSEIEYLRVCVNWEGVVFSMEIKFTDDNYSEYFSQDRLTVIDFWATWCGPCQRLAPIVAQIAEEYEGRVFVGKYNAENNEELLERFGVRNIPTILVVKNGEAVDRLTGAVNAAKIRELIDKNL